MSVRTTKMLMLGAACSLALAGCAGRYDGKWWRTVSVDEQTGFLAGLVDCEAYDLRTPGMADVSWTLAQRNVGAYYATHEDDRGKPVTSVFDAVARASVPPSAGRGGGEAYPEPHGVFDGELWRQSSAEYRQGFVAGYAECRKRSGKSLEHAPEWFVPRISEWYRIRGDDSDPQRAPEKIANVIARVAKP